jgi:hypothetical protein
MLPMKKINTLSGNILTNLLSFVGRNFFVYYMAKNCFASACNWAPRLTPLPTNRARTCKKMTVSSLVIQMIILNYFSDVLIFSVTFL